MGMINIVTLKGTLVLHSPGMPNETSELTPK